MRLSPRRFPDRIIRRRRDAGTRSKKGRWVEGDAQEVELICSLQWASRDESVERFGTRPDERIIVFVPEPPHRRVRGFAGAFSMAFARSGLVIPLLIAEADESAPDEVQIVGDPHQTYPLFIVAESRTWPGSHTRSVLERKT